MKYAGAGVLLGLGFLVTVVACEVDDGFYRHGGGGGHGLRTSCAAQASCGACTPVLGCGWCTFANGDGACVSHPDRCGEVADASAFEWTWNPDGCRVFAEAGIADAADDGP